MESGKIYKIVSDKTDKIYIGSIVRTIEKPDFDLKNGKTIDVIY